MTLISKESVVVAMIRSSAVKPGTLAIEHKRLTAALCWTRTPFGLPVEPEV